MMENENMLKMRFLFIILYNEINSYEMTKFVLYLLLTARETIR